MDTSIRPQRIKWTKAGGAAEVYHPQMQPVPVVVSKEG